MMTRIIKVDPDAIDLAAIDVAVRVIEEGGLVAFPTETVYGLAASLLHKKALSRLTEIKQRPAEKSFSIHIPEAGYAERYAQEILPSAYKIMDKFWPGPVTVVLKSPGDKSVGLRVPDHEIACQLLRRVDGPVIAPSANPAGETAPTTAQQVLAYFDGKIELLLDGGSTPVGVESTVVDARVDPPVILRQGAVRAQDILDAAKATVVLFVCTGNSCRSVMAEYAFRKIIKDAGRMDVEVFSAGTMALPGMSPTRETLKLVAGMGVDASGHKAQRVTPMMVRRADLILTMERRHYEDLVAHFPGVQKKTHVLGDYIGMDPAFSDIADPIGHSEDFYASCFAQIKAAMTRLKDRI